MTRSLKVYQGEDETPVYDLTEPTSPVHVIWEEVEGGGRAFRGESSLSSFPMRDERGESGSELNLPAGLSRVSLSAGSRLEWLVNGHRLFRGRVGPKDYSRGRQKADRAREVTVSAQDTNFDLRNIIVDGWARGEETDVTRVSALVSEFLSGSPRASTNISTTYLASGSNTVTLGPRVYDATDPATILAEIAQVANKLHFVTIDDELFYDGYDSSAYQAGIRISDRLDELDTTAVECGGGESPGVESSGSALGNSGTSTIAVSVPSGSGGLYFALMTHSGVNNITVDYVPDSGGAGYPMALIGSITHSTDIPDSGSGTKTKLNIYFLADPPTGVDAPSINFNHTGVPGGFQMGYWVTDSAATPSVTTATGVGTSSSIDPSAGATDLVLDVMGWRHQSFSDLSNDPSPTASQTEDWSRAHNAPNGQNDAAWGGGNKVGSGARTWSWTDSNPWVAAAIIVPSAGPSEVATFPPIWDVGPSSTEDGMQLLSGLRLYYGQGSNTYVYVNDPTTANQYWHSEQSLYTSDPAINTASRATTLAQAILQRRKYEERTYNVSIGPLEESHIGCLKPGQLISIKARAIPDADDQFVSRRIAQLRWTTPVPGMYFAHMQLDRPIKEAPYGVGPKTATDSINRHVEQGSNSHPEYVQRGVLVNPGDIPYRGASDWTRLPIGASNTHLISDGSAPKWATQPTSSPGGGTGLLVPNLLNSEKASADTPDDDFDGTSLDAKWTAVDGSAGAVSLLSGSGTGVYEVGERDGWLSMLIGTASGSSVELLQNYTLPDGNCIVAAFAIAQDQPSTTSNNEVWVGIGVNQNDSGPFSGTAGLTAAVIVDTDAPGMRTIGWDGSTTIGNGENANTQFGDLMFLRIDRVGLVYHLFYSRNGYAWNYIGSKTMASQADNVWLFAQCNATMSNRQVISAAWFRQGTALALDPWPLT